MSIKTEELAMELFPEEIVKNFELIRCRRKKKEIIFYFEKKESRILEKAKLRNVGKRIVLNGYLKPIELVHFPVGG